MNVRSCPRPASAELLEADDKAARGRLRIFRVNLTAVASVGFRGAMLLAGFLYIPATIRYLGPERYGLWVAMTSIVTLLAFADCGLGSSLMNDVAYSIGRGRDDSARRSISSTFFALAGVGVAGCLVFALANPFIPWQSAFRTRTLAEAAEASRAVAVIVCGFLVALPFTTVQRVQSAHQEGFKTQAWEIGGVALSLLGLFGAIRLHAGLPALAVVFTAGPLLAMVLNWLFYFMIERPAESPAWRLFNLRLGREIAAEGGYFLILQLAGVAVFSIDTFIVLHYFGQAAFAKYCLVAKLFQVAPALAGVWLAALWPAYAEAIARGDHQWVRRTLRRSTLGAAGGCVLALCGVAILARPVIHLWTGVEVDPSAKLLAGWVVYWAIVTGTSSIAVYLNGSKFIKGQAILVAIHAGSSVLLKILLCKHGDISGAVWGTNLAYLLVILPAYAVIVPRLLRRQDSMARRRAGSGSWIWGRVHLLRHALTTLLIAALARPRGRRQAQPGPPRILVTRLDGIGDFVLTSPFLRELRRNFPDSHITLWVGAHVAPLAETCPYVDRVTTMAHDPKREAFSRYPDYLLAFARHMRRLLAAAGSDLLGEEDLAIQPTWDMDTGWSTLITFLSGAPRRIGYSVRTSPEKAWRNFGFGCLFTDVLPPGAHRHEVERNLDIVRYLGGSVESVTPEVWLTAEDRFEADRFLDEHGLDGDCRIVAFGIGAFDKWRRWPFYGDLIGLLSPALEFRPLLLSGPGEEAIARGIVAACPSAIVMERMPWRVVASVLSRCSLFVGNDSGPMHVAAAAGCPVVEISCHPVGGRLGHPNDPERFGPLGVPRLIIRPKAFVDDCKQGCQRSVPHCIASIAAEEVAPLVLRFSESIRGLERHALAEP
jgi:heptosyltransferase-2